MCIRDRFFDMPGTLKSNGVVKTLSQMDYIFAPMSADRFVVESTLQFAVMFLSLIHISAIG